MYSIKIFSTGFPEAVAKIKKVVDIVENDRDEMAIAALHKVGADFERNFQSEGRQSGRPWRGLADRTRRERESKGFAPDHPILVRYGGLKYATSTYLKTAPKNATFYTSDPDGKSVGITISTGSDSATVYAYGEKAANQVGGGPSDVPARPYWFVTNQVTQHAKEGVVEWLADAIKKVV